MAELTEERVREIVHEVMNHELRHLVEAMVGSKSEGATLMDEALRVLLGGQRILQEISTTSETLQKQVK